MRLLARPALLLGLLAVTLGVARADEGKTYMSLWGSLFSGKNYTLPGGSVPKPSAWSWAPDSLVEIQARLLQRIAELSSQRQNQTSGGGGSSSNGGGGEAATLGGSAQGGALGNASLSASQQLRTLFGGAGDGAATDAPLPSNITAALLSTLGAAGADASALLQRLKDDFSRMDQHQLVAVAMLQGWALASAASAAAKHTKQAAALAARREAPPGPVLVPEPGPGGAFQPAVCLGLQNFGEAEGYRAVYLGPPPCGHPSSAASPYMAWGGTAAFLLECRPLDAAPAPSSSQLAAAAPAPAGSGGSGESRDESTAVSNGTVAAGGAGDGKGSPAAQKRRARALLTLAQLLAGDAERQGAFSKLSSLLRGGLGAEGEGGGRLGCQVAVTSSSGRGALLQYGGPQGAVQELPYQGQLNALQVRVCNTAPAQLQAEAAAAPSGSSVAVRDLHIGGKPALREPLAVAQSGSADGCVTQLYRLGGRGGFKGVSVSGWVDLNPGDAGFPGVGDMASVVVTLGQLVSQAA